MASLPSLAGRENNYEKKERERESETEESCESTSDSMKQY